MKSGAKIFPMSPISEGEVISQPPLPPLPSLSSKSKQVSTAAKPVKVIESILSPTPTISGAPSPILPPLPKSELPTLKPITKTALPPVSKTELPVLKSPLPPVSKTELPALKPITKTALPPVSKKELPPVSKKELPPVSKTALPPVSKKELPVLKSPLPPVSKTELPVLKSAITSPPTTKLPPLKPLRSGAEPLVVMDPLAVQIRETREEQIQKITQEVEEKESLQKPRPIIGISEDIKHLTTLKPLTSLPALMPTKELVKSKEPVKLPAPPSLPKAPIPLKTSLMISQEGVEKAKLAEPEASFQKKVAISSLPPISGLPSVTSKLPPISSPSELPVVPFPTTGEESLTIIASPANLPSKRSRESTPKIRIPKIKSSPVKPSPQKRTSIKSGGIQLPSISTVIPQIPIKSPSAITMSKVVSAEVPASDVMENIKKIDLNKLRAERSGKIESYSVTELKVFAGALNLTKSGSKKDLVERIKTAILKVNPTAKFP